MAILQGNKAPFSVLDKADPCFRELIKTLDTLTSELGLLETVPKLLKLAMRTYFG